MTTATVVSYIAVDVHYVAKKDGTGFYWTMRGPVGTKGHAELKNLLSHYDMDVLPDDKDLNLTDGPFKTKDAAERDADNLIVKAQS